MTAHPVVEISIKIEMKPVRLLEGLEDRQSPLPLEFLQASNSFDKNKSIYFNILVKSISKQIKDQESIAAATRELLKNHKRDVSKLDVFEFCGGLCK